ncbi:isochorismatase family protein, partial [Xanthovirga aplysinae]|uniref:isochorismatase family protein n=1 Tax=Xanthovirga aplysinae TaxID=2529853 RepID=UPI0012BCC759
NNGVFIKKHVRDAFSNKKLDSVLNANQIGNLYITGIDAKYCVNSTIEAGLLRNYNISYIKELVATNKREELTDLTERWAEKGVREIKFYHLIEELSKN